MAPLRVCIDARLNGVSGGVLSFLVGLASSLSGLTDGPEEYLFLTYPDCDDWLRPHLSGPCRLLAGEGLGIKTKRKLVARVPLALSVWKGMRRVQQWLARPEPRPVTIPLSSGLIERHGVEVMHFAQQGAFLTNVPSLYQPMDLQHLHLRQYFSDVDFQARETLYRTFCRQARTVIAISEWGRQDLIANYALPADKVWTVPLGGSVDHLPAPTTAAIADCRRAHRLPEEFILLPAQTMPHKNHLGLLEALARLRDRRQLRVPLVCCGHRTDHYAEIRRQVRKLGLRETCRFLGSVSFGQLGCLYRLCKLVVFPTLFEGFGIPVLEAFAHSAPLACSNVPCLPEVAGDAARLFDPYDPDAIGEAITQLWTDAAARAELVRRGERRVQAFAWPRVARLFRAHYRRLANRLTEEDRALLAAPRSAEPMSCS
jgi:glycosyltransferase involved in cell wall biosynthesis